MTHEFGVLSKDGSQIVKILYRGQSYKNTNFGMGASDSEYISKGYLPIRSEFPVFDTKTQHYTHELVIHGTYIERVYTIIDYTLFELKEQKLTLVKKMAVAYEASRPKVEVILDNGSTIEVDGSRLDKDNFKEKYQLMDRFGIPSDDIKDAYNVLHTATRDDVERAYLNIVVNYNDKMKAKWAKEHEIRIADGTQINEIDLSI